MMVVILVILGVAAVAGGITTAVLVARDSVGSRPYCSGYDSRHPQ
jgi:hypothetical protein